MRTDINQSKQQLVQAFYHRLIDSYGYVPEQMELNVEIDADSNADIAIWRSAVYALWIIKSK